MLIYLFYLLPFLLLAIYGLAWPGCSWLPDWSLLVAGAVAQVGKNPGIFWGGNPNREGLRNPGIWVGKIPTGDR